MARHLITSAIPYLNGIKHLGNLVGSQLPADLYARYLRGRGHEVLFKVELPCALPLIASGLRSAALQVVATATLAAAVGLGGLGRFLLDGLAVRAPQQTLTFQSAQLAPNR